MRAFLLPAASQWQGRGHYVRCMFRPPPLHRWDLLRTSYIGDLQYASLSTFSGLRVDVSCACEVSVIVTRRAPCTMLEVRKRRAHVTTERPYRRNSCKSPELRHALRIDSWDPSAPLFVAKQEADVKVSRVVVALQQSGFAPLAKMTAS